SPARRSSGSPSRASASSGRFCCCSRCTSASRRAERPRAAGGGRAVTTPERAWLPLGALLHGAGLITEQQLAQALARQTERGCPVGQAVGDPGFFRAPPNA